MKRLTLAIAACLTLSANAQNTNVSLEFVNTQPQLQLQQALTNPLAFNLAKMHDLEADSAWLLNLFVRGVPKNQMPLGAFNPANRYRARMSSQFITYSPSPFQTNNVPYLVFENPSAGAYDDFTARSHSRSPLYAIRSDAEAIALDDGTRLSILGELNRIGEATHTLASTGVEVDMGTTNALLVQIRDKVTQTDTRLADWFGASSASAIQTGVQTTATQTTAIAASLVTMRGDVASILAEIREGIKLTGPINVSATIPDTGQTVVRPDSVAFSDPSSRIMSGASDAATALKTSYEPYTFLNPPESSAPDGTFYFSAPVAAWIQQISGISTNVGQMNFIVNLSTIPSYVWTTIHLLITSMASLWAAGLIWEEVRRYG